ncbi:MAG: hypothetical protein M5R40_27540 [Anaerolineae bacterium]|nr:hypothetical protein [Anaerolineae bacterium]
MSNLLQRLTLAALLCLLFTSPGISPFPAETAQAAFAHPVIADHRHTNITQVPAAYIELAKQQFRVWYGHTSHGSQVTTGMQILRAQNSLYSYNSGAGSLSYVEPSGVGDLGSPDWITYTRTQLNRADNDRNVVMWSWCGQLSTATEANVDFYLTEMSRLEANYPNVHFIYMTGHLDGTGPTGNLYARNNQIRQYVLTHNKILYDFADIESYNPAGVYFPDETDACGWCQSWCNTHACPTCTSTCEHSHCFNCYQKGKAFWALLAMMAGLPNPPGQPTLTAPNGTIIINNPVYSWNAVQGATSYRLYVGGADGMVIDERFQAPTVCPNATCSATPGASLANGAYQWWVQARNDGGDGPWSNPMHFTVAVPVPGAATLTSPTGNIGADNQPTYWWNDVQYATHYQLYVSGPNSYVFNGWVRDAVACNGTTCSHDTGATLANGAHTWWVRTWSSGGYGPWSASMDFFVGDPLPPAPTPQQPTGTLYQNAPAFQWRRRSTPPTTACTWKAQAARC